MILRRRARRPRSEETEAMAVTEARLLRPTGGSRAR
jgi:hypothetical protein